MGGGAWTACGKGTPGGQTGRPSAARGGAGRQRNARRAAHRMARLPQLYHSTTRQTRHGTRRKSRFFAAQHMTTGTDAAQKRDWEGGLAPLGVHFLLLRPCGALIVSRRSSCRFPFRQSKAQTIYYFIYNINIYIYTITPVCARALAHVLYLILRQLLLCEKSENHS